ncbi:hypothetical protein AAFF_G00136330 [Aldrovandia affinis]|uniref:SGNH hydrolase-type esterase domain-containing protein n=1 Tax=Aldrovandia affinis TaxID=143900 RepID=A0AAD7W8V2_9TELE|nr:hypothetical protein AAFF_G00136330 [Aldrovandia affinis]
MVKAAAAAARRKSAAIRKRSAGPANLWRGAGSTDPAMDLVIPLAGSATPTANAPSAPPTATAPPPLALRWRKCPFLPPSLLTPPVGVNPPPHPPPQPTEPHPTALVVGSSMVRHIVVPKAVTYSMPGATVSDINSVITMLIEDHPQASSDVLHVGANDLKFQQSETLKKDFMTLINTVSESGKACIISRPFSSPRYGDVKYSRICNLHIWLKGYCCSLSIPFIDNFTMLWDRKDLFARDGLHLNRDRARMLSLSMDLALKSHASSRSSHALSRS